MLIVLYDASCRVCARWRQFAETRVPRGSLRFVDLASDDAQTLLSPTDPALKRPFTTIVVFDPAAADIRLTKWRALTAVGVQLRQPWRTFAHLGRLIPRALGDRLYDLTARSRRFL